MTDVNLCGDQWHRHGQPLSCTKPAGHDSHYDAAADPGTMWGYGPGWATDDVKALRADIAQLQAAVAHLTAQLRQKEAQRAAVALERDSAWLERDHAEENVRRRIGERDHARADATAERALRVEADDQLLSAIAEAERLKRQREELIEKRTDLLDIRGLLSPNGGVTALPAGMDIGERVAPAVEWLIGAYEAVLAVAEAATAWRAGLLLVSATVPERKANDELRTKNRMALQDAVDEWQSTQPPKEQPDAKPKLLTNPWPRRPSLDTHALREPGCTGVSARRCPVHGACSCTSGGEGGTHLEDPDCPLHGENSDHMEAGADG